MGIQYLQHRADLVSPLRASTKTSSRLVTSSVTVNVICWELHVLAGFHRAFNVTGWDRNTISRWKFQEEKLPAWHQARAALAQNQAWAPTQENTQLRLVRLMQHQRCWQKLQLPAKAPPCWEVSFVPAELQDSGTWNGCESREGDRPDELLGAPVQLPTGTRRVQKWWNVSDEHNTMESGWRGSSHHGAVAQMAREVLCCARSKILPGSITQPPPPKSDTSAI